MILVGKIHLDPEQANFQTTMCVVLVLEPHPMKYY